MGERLSARQMRFTWMTAQLINYAFSIGIGLTYGDAYATDGHKDDSFHYKRLAVDFNAFDLETGEYLRETEDHAKLGRFWKMMGGTWGGDFSKPDGNHYSYGE